MWNFNLSVHSGSEGLVDDGLMVIRDAPSSDFGARAAREDGDRNGQRKYFARQVDDLDERKGFPFATSWLCFASLKVLMREDCHGARGGSSLQNEVFT